MKKLTVFIVAAAIFCGTNLFAECISGNCINGKGAYKFPSGSYYSGEFKDGKFHGEGTFFFYNGSQYKGTWESGEMSGKGTWRYSNGMKLKADFVDGKVSGDAVPDPVIVYNDFNYISSLLPKGTDAVFLMKSIEDIFTQFPITDDSVFGSKIGNIERLRRQVGFNPFSKKELSEQGIDLTRQVGVAISDIKFGNAHRPAMNVVICVPVKKDPRLVQTIKDVLKKITRNNVRYELEGDVLKILSRRHGKGFKKSFCMAMRNGYLFLGHNPNGDVAPYVQKIMERKNPLSGSEIYKNVVNSVDAGEEAFMYIDGSKLFEIYGMFLAQASRTRGLDYRSRMMMNLYGSLMKNTLKVMKDYRGLGITLNYDRGDLVMNSVANLKADSELLKLYQGITYDKKNILGMNSKPLGIISLGINFKEYVNFIVKSLPPFIGISLKSKMDNLKKKENIDIQAELIDNLAGNVNAGFFNASRFSRDNMSIFFTVNVKDVAVMKALMKKFIATAPKGKIESFRLGKIRGSVINAKKTKIFFGMSGKSLVVALSRPVFLSSMRPRMSRTFLNKIDPEVAKIIRKDATVFYIDAAETVKAVENFSSMDKKKSKYQRGKDITFETAMKEFYYLYLYSYNVDNKFYSKMRLKTKFDKPFFRGLSDLIQRIQDMEKKRKKELAPVIRELKRK